VTFQLISVQPVANELRFEEQAATAADLAIGNAFAPFGWLVLKPDELKLGVLHQGTQNAFDPRQGQATQDGQN
jgi:hypothetical protein